MYCPQCGQQQVAGTVRFCSRCGFLLEGTMQVLANGGSLPASAITATGSKLSPHQKGIRQGALLMLSTLLVVPVLSILTVNIIGNPRIIIPLAAFFCFIGGLLRIVYALLMEDATPHAKTAATQSYAPPIFPAELGVGARSSSGVNALPPQQSVPAPLWRSRMNTAELVEPPSVTENTTRLLDEKSDTNAR